VYNLVDRLEDRAVPSVNRWVLSTVTCGRTWRVLSRGNDLGPVVRVAKSQPPHRRSIDALQLARCIAVRSVQESPAGRSTTSNQEQYSRDSYILGLSRYNSIIFVCFGYCVVMWQSECVSLSLEIKKNYKTKIQSPKKVYTEWPKIILNMVINDALFRSRHQRVSMQSL